MKEYSVCSEELARESSMWKKIVSCPDSNIHNNDHHCIHLDLGIKHHISKEGIAPPTSIRYLLYMHILASQEMSCNILCRHELCGSALIQYDQYVDLIFIGHIFFGWPIARSVLCADPPPNYFTYASRNKSHTSLLFKKLHMVSSFWLKIKMNTKIYHECTKMLLMLSVAEKLSHSWHISKPQYICITKVTWRWSPEPMLSFLILCPHKELLYQMNG